MTSAPLVVDAPAKLTLTLRITGVRADGLHLLDAEMVTVDLADRLMFRPAEPSPDDRSGGWLDVGGPFAGDAPPGEGNLVARALAAVGRRAHVHLDKRIPARAGLGGGSADAAAVLRWAGCHDAAVAAGLGADVPFCLVGGRARVTGAGEVVEPLDPEATTITLVTPPLEVDTAAAYRAWDELGGPTGEAGNDLEPAAVAVEPRLAAWREVLGHLAGVRPRLAGSGSTWWLPGDHARRMRETDPSSWPDGRAPRLVVAVSTTGPHADRPPAEV